MGQTDTTLSDHRPVEALFQPPSDGAVDLGRTEVGQPQGGESMLTWREERAGAYSQALAADTEGLQRLDTAIAAGDDEAAAAELQAAIWRAATSS